MTTSTTKNGGGEETTSGETPEEESKGDSETVSEESEQDEDIEEEEEEPEPESKFNTFGDGIHIVGQDIQPGTYRTREGSSWSCYYARLSGFGGSLDEILANDSTDYPAVVTILSSDKGFETSGCGTWTDDLSQITEKKTEFTNGIFIVGTDVEPGTYKSSGSEGCYYARLSGFSGILDEILANDNTDAAAVVTIQAGDKGFQSSNCGMWVKVN